MGADLENLLAQLQQDKSLKVWSLIVTLFGDAVVPRGGNVSAKTIQAVLASMGIGAGAVRTALSRLAADRWIERHKLGRESFYELAGDGYEPVRQASLRIYAPVTDHNTSMDTGSWTMAMYKPGSKDKQAPQGSVNLAGSGWLCFDTEIGSGIDSGIEIGEFKDHLLVTGDLRNVPAWLTDTLVPESLQHGYQSLVSRFSAIQNIEKLSPLMCLVLRCLLIHEWRRLLLRTLIVPQALQGPDWPEKSCRQFVCELYFSLIEGSESWLNENATCIKGSLPKASDDIRARFTSDFTGTI